MGNTISNNWFNVISLLLIAVIGVFFASINFRYGIGQDQDAYLIKKMAYLYNSSGFYVQSRTWGFPLYEMLIYPLISFFGLTAAKYYSLFFYLGCTLIFYFILKNLIENEVKIFLLTLTFALHPILIISGNTIMETSQGLFFALLGLLFFLKSINTNKVPFFYLTLLFLALATGTRPDYVIFSFCIYMSYIIIKKKIALNLLLAGFFYVVISLLPYLVLYKEWLVPLNIINAQNITSKLIKVFLGYLALVGIPLIIVLLFYVGKNFKNFKISFKNPILCVSIPVFILYTIRFWMLPDEVEYILILYPLILILLSVLLMNSNTSYLFYLLIVLCSLIPNTIQLHFFERERNGELKPKIGLCNGIIKQDRSMRLQNEYEEKELPLLLKDMATQLGYNHYAYGPSMEKNKLVFSPFEKLRMYIKGRENPRYYEAFLSQKVIGFDMPSNNGWKQFIKYNGFQKVSKSNLYHVNNVVPFIISPVF